jgi:excisionase family DNA binding protein
MSQLLNIQQVAAHLKVHRSTVYRMVEDGQLPKPIMIRSSPRWHLNEIEEAIRFPSKKKMSLIVARP